MTALLYVTTIVLFCGTVLLVFRYIAAALTARARIAAEGAYQALAEKTVALQAQNEAALAGIKAELAGLAASVSAVEQILKQVG